MTKIVTTLELEELVEDMFENYVTLSSDDRDTTEKLKEVIGHELIQKADIEDIKHWVKEGLAKRAASYLEQIQDMVG